MIKFKHNDKLYYFAEKEHLLKALETCLYLDTTHVNDLEVAKLSTTGLMNLADYVIDTEEDRIIKSRSGVTTFEEILDLLLEDVS